MKTRSILLALALMLFGGAAAQSPITDAIALERLLRELPTAKDERSAADTLLLNMKEQVTSDSAELDRLATRGKAPTQTQQQQWARHRDELSALTRRYEHATARDILLKDSIGVILQPYLRLRGENTRDRAAIGGLIEVGNPFLTAAGIGVPSISDGADGNFPASLVRQASASNLDVTNLAAGLADFLVERAKTELNTAFFQRFQETLEKEEFKDLRILFPETARLLGVIGNEVYRYNSYINNLRTAFNNDLDGMLRHAPEVVERHRAALDTVKGLYPSLMIGLDAAAQLDDGTHPGKAIDGLSTHAQLPELKKAFPELGNGLHLAAMISESLRSDSDSLRYWATEDELEKLKDDTVFTIYLGLLLEWSKSKKYERIVFTNTAVDACAIGNAAVTIPANAPLKEALTSIGKCWDKLSEDRRKLEVYINAMAAEVKGLETSLKTLRDLPKDLDAQEALTAAQRRRHQFEAVSAVVSSTLDVIEHTYTAERLPFVPLRVPEKARMALDQSRSALRMFAAVDQKQYGSAITELASMLRYASDQQSDSITLSNPMLQRLLRYGSFMAALVESESPEQAKAAIEAAALPPGSYSIKRNSGFSVSLNGYIGPFYGREDIENAENEDFNNYGLTAPIGIAANWGNIPRSWKHKLSIGLFAPLIDVGAVASYRGKDNVTTTVPKITLGSIVAPGLFLEVGIPGTPLTIGYGWQMGPTLREVTSDSTSIVLGDFYERRVFTLKVDIPIVHFGASTGRNSRPYSMAKRNKLNDKLVNARHPEVNADKVKELEKLLAEPKLEVEKRKRYEAELKEEKNPPQKMCKAKCLTRKLKRR